jgi:hypothetical protein
MCASLRARSSFPFSRYAQVGERDQTKLLTYSNKDQFDKSYSRSRCVLPRSQC